MLHASHTVADIGCDHGRLSAALLQSGAAVRIIAADISPASLDKAHALARLTGLCDRMDIRLADGLSAIAPGEADALALCGMGGTLIVELLTAAKIPLMGAQIAVFQPMRGVEELRQYLFENGYRVTDDVIVPDAGRLYQVFSVERGQDELPHGWPADCFALGHRSLSDVHFPVLAHHMLAQHEKRLKTAHGTAGQELLEQKAAHMRSVLELYEKQQN
jgi:tRNA A22 N-methylase